VRRARTSPVFKKSSDGKHPQTEKRDGRCSRGRQPRGEIGGRGGPAKINAIRAEESLRKLPEILDTMKKEKKTKYQGAG